MVVQVPPHSASWICSSRATIAARHTSTRLPLPSNLSTNAACRLSYTVRTVPTEPTDFKGTSYIHEAPQDSWLMYIPIFLLTSSWWPCRYLLAQLPGYAVPVSPVRQGLQAQDFPYQAPQVWMRHGGTVPMPTLPLQSQAEGLLEITYIYETPTDSWLIINIFVLFLWHSLKLFDCIVIYYKQFCSIK